MGSNIFKEIGQSVCDHFVFSVRRSVCFYYIQKVEYIQLSQDAKFYLLHLASMFVLQCRYSMKGILLESMEIRFDYRLLHGFTKSLVGRNGKKREGGIE